MILIINNNRKDAQRLSEMLYFMGVVSYAATPTEALSEFSIGYSAALIMNPNTLADKEDFVSRLRKYANLPIFALSDTHDAVDSLIFEGVIKWPSYASKILSYLTDFCASRGFRAPGTYKLAGIDASVNLTTPIYFSKALSFTKTELMILRTLIVTYPTPINAFVILKYAFKPNGKPDIQNVRTHISVMNKKFRSIANRNLTVLTPRAGYRILTPEIIEALI